VQYWHFLNYDGCKRAAAVNDSVNGLVSQNTIAFGIDEFTVFGIAESSVTRESWPWPVETTKKPFPLIAASIERPVEEMDPWVNTGEMPLIKLPTPY